MKGLIRLCVRRDIHASSSGEWEKLVFADTYREFFMQAQQFDQERKWVTFKQMRDNIPKSEEMHYLVSTAAVEYIRQLKGFIPELSNTFGQRVVSFKNFKFEIIDSSVRDKQLHHVAINFYSEPLIWIESFNGNLVVADPKYLAKLEAGDFVETQTIPVSKDMSVAFFQPMTRVFQKENTLSPL